jgi:cytochrome b
MAREVRLSMRVWDAPTRLFHWAIVILVALAYASWRLGWKETHFLAGYALLALLLFRLAWGFVGSETSRFRQFLVSPLSGLRYLAHWRAGRGPDNQVGHNAAGGWVVLVMLLLLAAQTGTGLFAHGAAMNQGPLANAVGPGARDQLTAWHARLWNVLLAAIALHLLAILAFALFRRQDLIRPMLTGRKRLPGRTRPPRMASPLLALLVLAVAAVITWAIVALLPRFA